MSTERKAIRDSVIAACFYFVFSLVIYVAFFHVFPHPFVRDLPIEVHAKIQNAKIQDTQDIEWLRDVALQLESADRQNNKHLNEFIESGIILLIVIGVTAGWLFLNNYKGFPKFASTVDGF